MSIRPDLSLPSPSARVMLVLNAILLVLFALALHNSPAPRIEIEFDGATVDIRADRAWAMLPGDCLIITWDLEGIHSLYIDGQGKIGWGEMTYCPSLIAASPQFEVTSANGEEQLLSLGLRYFPMELIRSLCLFAILLILLIASYYLVTMRLSQPLPLNARLGLALLALLIVCLLGQTGYALRLQSIVAFLIQIFQSHTWQMFGIVAGGLVYIPLVLRAVKSRPVRKAPADWAAMAIFFVFLLLLFLPFGFDSIGHWEEWVINAYFEGRPSKLGAELTSRIWVVAPHALAYAIDSESFVGYHLVNLFMFWGKLALMYGILRHLSFSPVYAFLTTMLFMVYPVNSALISLRSFPMQFSMLGLLAAVYLALDYRRNNPSRLLLIGIWLGLIFNIASNESAYVLILLTPLYWWARSRSRASWGKFNWTVLWYLFPACKIIYLFGLVATSQDFYPRGRISRLLAADSAGSPVVTQLIQNLARVYENTAHVAWAEAFDSLRLEAFFIGWTLLMVAVVAGAAAFLAHVQCGRTFPANKDAALMVLAGILFIVPSVAVLIWFEDHNDDLWRMYFYVPIGAAVAVFGLSSLLASMLGSARARSIIVSAFLLALMIPATNRLLHQHAQVTRSADLKAIMLQEMMEQARSFDSNAIAIMLTDKNLDELEALGIHEFESNMLDSAFHVLWQEEGPRFAFLCFFKRYCHPSDIDVAYYPLNEKTSFGELVFFRVHDDLTIELLRELPPELREYARDSYNPDRLIDASAPIPSRAHTMLASARRG